MISAKNTLDNVDFVLLKIMFQIKHTRKKFWKKNWAKKSEQMNNIPGKKKKQKMEVVSLFQNTFQREDHLLEEAYQTSFPEC